MMLLALRQSLVRNSASSIKFLKCSTLTLKNNVDSGVVRKVTMQDVRVVCKRALSSSTSSSKIVNHNNSNNDNNEQGEIIRFLSLNNLADNPGAIKKKRRVGRGIGSSKGKTCGRGHKGQNSRAGGGVRPTFEGGQTPLFKRLPKRGFKNTVHETPMLPINLGMLQDFVDMGRLPTNKTLTMKDLVEAGVATMSSVKHGMKLLSKGRERLTAPLKLQVSRASVSAIEALEAVGGEVSTVHFNRLALRALLKPHKFQLIPKRARPPPKFMPYYTSYKNRGYLSLEMQLKTMNLQLDNLDIGGGATVVATSSAAVQK